MFFYNKDTNYEEILRIIDQYPQDTMIVTNRSGLNAYLQNKKKKSFMIAEQVSEQGSVGEEIYARSKKYFEEFEAELGKKSYLGVSMLDGFSYALLRKLYLFAQSEKILEREKNIIFIFENYSPIYFSIVKLASKIGFNNKERIGLIVKDKLNFFHMNQGIELLNSLSKNRFKNFQQNIGNTDPSQTKLKTRFLFFNKLSSLLISKIKFKTQNIVRKNEIEDVLNNIRTKINKFHENNKVDVVFFLTTTRADLYLKPWYPILDKFKKSKKSFMIVTSDLTTDLILEKEGILHLNLFEEINLLQNYFRSNKNSVKFIELFNLYLLKKNSFFGTTPMLDDVLKNMYRSMAVTTLCDSILKDQKPNSLVAMADGEMLECLAVSIGKKFNIPTFSTSPTLPNPHPLLSDWLHAEKIFIDGTKHSETLIKLGYSKERILLVGNPRYDLYNNANIQDAKNLLRKKYDIDEKKKLIVIAMSKWRKDDQRWMSDLIKFCNKKNFEIVIKVHPKFKSASNEISEKKISEIKNDCSTLKFLISYDIDLVELIPAADLIVTDHSSVGLEAVVAKKPLISINFFKEDWGVIGNDLRVDRFGASLYIEDYSTFEKRIIDILDGKKFVSELNKGQTSIVERYNYYNDGNTASRIFDILLKN